MALGSLTYKTPVKIANIASNLTDKAGFIVSLTSENRVALCTTLTARPYGVIVVGCDSLTPGTYPSQIAAGALELVDAYGSVIVAMAGGTGVTFGNAVSVTNAGTCEDSVLDTAGQWIVGYALSAAAAGESFLLSFQPTLNQVTTP
jgi:hypothetical protein